MARRFSALVGVLGVLAIAVECGATCPTIPERLAAYVQTPDFAILARNFGIDAKDKNVHFVVYDHRADPKQALSAYGWRRDDTPAANEFIVEAMAPVDGMPNLQLPRNSHVVFVLANTTPPLYKLSKTTTTTDIKGLADLQSIAGGFGTVVQSLLKASAARTNELAVDGAGPGESFEWIPTPTEKLQRLEKTTKATLEQAQILETLKAKTVTYLSLAEQNVPESDLSQDKVAHTQLTALFADTYRKFRDLEQALSDVQATPFVDTYGCAALAEIARGVVALNDAERKADDKLAALHRAIELTSCSSPAKRYLLLLLATQTKAHVADYLFISDGLRQTIDLAKQTLAKRTDAGSLAASLQTIGDRLKTISPADDPCDLAFGFVAADSPDKVEFTKQGIVKATITEAAPLGATYPRRLNGATETQFRISNPIADRLGAAAGLIYTPLDEPTYKAITNPLKADEKVISKTDATARAGELALFVNYWLTRDDRDFRPGLQLGVGLSDTPAVFAGVSIDLGSFLRFGVGGTLQRIRDLGGNQRALKYNDDGTPDISTLTVVSSNDDIIYRNTHPVSTYVSLSITLDSLPFWKK